MEVTELTLTLTRVLDLAGVSANALLGSALARSRRFDPVGFAFLAVVCGLGGGLLRDTLLQAGPPVALTDWAYLTTALITATIAFLIHFEGGWWTPTYRFVDAIAVGCWAAVGTQKTLAVGLGWLPAILLGALTAVGGGIIRDILLQRTPVIFGGNTLYATSALLAAGTMVAMSTLGWATPGLLVSTAVGAGVCLAAHYRGWVLPSYSGFRPRSRPLPRLHTRLRGTQRDDR